MRKSFPHGQQDQHMELTGASNNASDGDFSINQLLINPFAGMTQTALIELQQRFLADTGIEEAFHDTIRKGAFLAQDAKAFSKGDVDGLRLTREEDVALQVEKTNKWDQPWMLYAVVFCCSMGAAVQGWDETAVNQAQVNYAEKLHIGDGLSGNPSVLLGLVNSAPYLCCALLGSWLTDPLNYYLGRRGTIFLACLISCLTCVWQGLVNSWQHLFIARLALGLGIGPKSATVPIYAAECSPKAIRGTLVMQWQVWTAFGIMLGYVSGVIFGDLADVNLRWRLTIASPAALPIVVCAYVWTLPESPRWLISKAKRKPENRKYYTKAFESLCKLRRTRLQAARDLFLINYSLENEILVREQHNRFIELFTVPRNRRALVAGCLLMFFQQFCGVNVLAYYSSLVFQKAGFQDQSALKASMGFGIINFVFAIPALYTIDTFGRRNLLLVTFPFMAIFQLLTGLGFIANKNSTARKVIVTVGMYLFSVAYSPGEGPVPFLYSSECMPMYVRDLGMSLFTATTWFFNFLLSITFPPFLRAFGEIGTFAYYAAWCSIGFILILLFVPETANQTLEELDARFSVPTRTHARYGINQLKWFFSRHVLQRRFTPKPTLDVPLRIPAGAATGGDSSAVRMGDGGSVIVRRKFPARERVEVLGTADADDIV